MIDFNLDPDRPFTAAEVNVDSYPVADGGLGTFFGGDRIFGPLTASYVPSELTIESDLDPSFCTSGLFPPFFPVPSDIDQQFTVGSTQVFVHARDLPQEMCVDWNIAGPTTTVQIEATDLAMNPSTAGIIEVLFRDTTGLPGGTVLFNDPANPLQELRVRLDDVPSFTTTATTTGNTHINIDTDNAAPFNVIGGLRLDASTTAGSPIPPTYPPLTGSEQHFVSITDQGANKEIDVQFIGLDELDLLLNGGASTLDFEYLGDATLPLDVDINSDAGGALFGGQEISVDLDVDDLPSFFDAQVQFDPGICYTASSGIDTISLSADIDPDGGADTNNTHLDIDADDLPANFCFDVDPDTGATLTAEDVGNNPDPVGNITFNLTNESGIDGSDGLLGQNLGHVRARLDDIPSLAMSWSNSPNVEVSFDTTDPPNSSLGGAQVAISTEVGLSPLAAPTGASNHYVTLRDEGGVDLKELKAGAFGIDNVSVTSDEANSQLRLIYDADIDRDLVVDVDTTFGGQFFPTFDIDATLTIDDVPEMFDLTVEFDPGFRYAASDSIDEITLIGTVDDTDDGMANGTDINFVFDNLPSEVRFSLEAGELKVIDGLLDINGDDAVDGADDGVAGGIRVINGQLDTNFSGGIGGGDDDTFLGANVIDGGIDINLDGTVDGSDDGTVNGVELKMNGSVSSVNLSLSSENAIFGSPYQLAELEILNIPAHTLATWAGERILVETKDAGGSAQPLGQISALISTDNDAPDITTKLEPFTDTGPGGTRINYSPFLAEIDDRYHTQGNSTSVIPRLDELYNDGDALDDGEDHIVAHMVGGTLDVASLQFTGFQKLLVDPGLDGGTYEFRKPVIGISPLFLGAGLDDMFATVQFDNIPDLIQLNTNIAGQDITWHTEDDEFDSIGDVDVYVGPAKMASDSDLAARFVMQDVPDDVHIFWDFGFPNGNATFDASNEFELLFLAQDGSNRLVGALQLEDLEVAYDIGFDVFFDVDWFGPIPTELALNILTAEAGIDNSADGAVGAGPGPGVDGFFALYSMTANPDPLVNPAGPAAGTNEYTPDLTFMMKDFKEFSLELNVGLELIPSFLSPEVELNLTLDGDFVFDFWAGEVDVTAEAFVEFGFLNVPDYTDNTPIHLVPGGISDADFDNLFDVVYTFVGFHGFGDHVDPFA